MGSVSDHCNKASQKNFFGFLLHVKFTFTLYCRLLSVQQHYVLENNVHTLILKGLRVPEELWTEVHNTVQEAANTTIPKKMKHKKAKRLSEEALQIAEQKREVKGKGERGRYTQPCRVPEKSKVS